MILYALILSCVLICKEKNKNHSIEEYTNNTKNMQDNENKPDSDKDNNKKDHLNYRQKHLKDVIENKYTRIDNGIDYLLFCCESNKIDIIKKPIKTLLTFLSSFVIPLSLIIFESIINKQNNNMDNSILAFKVVVLIAFSLFAFIIGLLIFIDYHWNSRALKNQFETDLRYLKTQI